jgi:hypothetical protein
MYPTFPPFHLQPPHARPVRSVFFPELTDYNLDNPVCRNVGILGFAEP